MFVEKQKLKRSEKRFVNKIKSKNSYKKSINLIYKIFTLSKKFFILRWKSIKKIIWVISTTSFYFLWKKFSYIYDFIVNKRKRWKWLWKEIFSKTLDKLDKENNNYVFLLSDKSRKRSHRIYKKLWFTIISLWIWIIAYKKFKK